MADIESEFRLAALRHFGSKKKHLIMLSLNTGSYQSDTDNNNIFENALKKILKKQPIILSLSIASYQYLYWWCLNIPQYIEKWKQTLLISIKQAGRKQNRLMLIILVSWKIVTRLSYRQYYLVIHKMIKWFEMISPEEKICLSEIVLQNYAFFKQNILTKLPGFLNRPELFSWKFLQFDVGTQNCMTAPTSQVLERC